MFKGSPSKRERPDVNNTMIYLEAGHAGGQMKGCEEARPNGRPTTKINWDGEAGPRRRPQ